MEFYTTVLEKILVGGVFQVPLRRTRQVHWLGVCLADTVVCYAVQLVHVLAQ